MPHPQSTDAFFSKQVTCCVKHAEASRMGLETKPKLTEMQIFPWNNRIYQTERRQQAFKNSFCLWPPIIDNKLVQWQAQEQRKPIHIARNHLIASPVECQSRALGLVGQKASQMVESNLFFQKGTHQYQIANDACSVTHDVALRSNLFPSPWFGGAH